MRKEDTHEQMYGFSRVYKIVLTKTESTKFHLLAFCSKAKKI